MREAAEFFKALGDETRLRMLWLLLNRRELCVCDFMEVLGVTQSKASRHLRNLYHAGLVTDRREGLWAYYSLRDPAEGRAADHLEALRRDLAGRKDSKELLKKLEKWLGRRERLEKAGCCRRG